MEDNPYQAPEHNDVPDPTAPRAVAGPKVAFSVITRAIGLWNLTSGCHNLLAALFISLEWMEVDPYYTVSHYTLGGAVSLITGAVLLVAAPSITHAVFRGSDW